MSQLEIEKEPKIIGLYGLPGSGKSTILQQLGADANYNDYLYFEGSEALDAFTVGGLNAFKLLDDKMKQQIRCDAIEGIRDRCLSLGKSAVVAGHFSFWEPAARDATEAWTESDAEVFTHIIYLAVDGETLTKFVKQDGRSRSDRVVWDAYHLNDWRDDEIRLLKKHCADNRNDVSFQTVTGGLNSTLDEVKQLIETRNLDEKSNRDRVADALKAALEPLSPALDAVLLIDGDKTLAPDDTGALLQRQIIGPGPHKDPLPAIFNTHGYTFTGFREAAMEYEKEGSDAHFIGECEKVARRVKMHPAFVSLLQQVAGLQSVKALVVTSGLRLIWERVLEQAGLSHAVKVIGGGREKDYVVTPKIKAMIARILKENGLYVVAFGDSVIDLPMLQQADQAIVVTGDENSRSKSMEVELKKTLIIPLMRGGEPMAFGVSDVFPLAAFLHAKQPTDIEKTHLHGMTNVILVDGVVNSGDSLVEFVKRIRELRPSVRIVAVSGVTQEDAVKNLPVKLAGCGGVTLFSLRTSMNKFTGKGGTDTGARLFGTTEME